MALFQSASVLFPPLAEISGRKDSLHTAARVPQPGCIFHSPTSNRNGSISGSLKMLIALSQIAPTPRRLPLFTHRGFGICQFSICWLCLCCCLGINYAIKSKCKHYILINFMESFFFHFKCVQYFDKKADTKIALIPPFIYLMKSKRLTIAGMNLHDTAWHSAGHTRWEKKFHKRDVKLSRYGL